MSTIWMATDIHLNGSAYVSDFGIENAEMYAEAFTTAVNAATKDAVIVCGDQPHRAVDIAQAIAFVNSIDGCRAVIGNHELQNAVDAAAAKAAAVSGYGMPASYYAFDVKFCRVIVLDTNFDADGNDAHTYDAYMTTAQKTWLQDELDTTTKDAVLIFMHAPPAVTRTNGTTTNMNADEVAALSAIMNSRPNVWVFAGHWHHNHSFSLGSVPVNVRRNLFSGYYTIITVRKLANGMITVRLAEPHV